MKRVRIDGKRMGDRDAAHRHLADRLSLPAHYGGNLDALWDVLSTRSEPVRIVFLHADRCVACLGGYGESLLQVFQDAAAANPALDVVIRPGPRGIGGTRPPDRPPAP